MTNYKKEAPKTFENSMCYIPNDYRRIEHYLGLVEDHFKAAGLRHLRKWDVEQIIGYVRKAWDLVPEVSE